MDLLEVRWSIPIRSLQLSDDLILFVIQNEITVALLTQRQLQCLSHVSHRYTECASTVSIDLDSQLRFIEAQICIDEGEHRMRRGLLEETGQHLFEVFQFRRLNDKLDR